MDFDPNDRAAIETALRDSDPHNPIAKALAERIKELTGRFWLHAEKLGRVPSEIMLVKPKTAFDDIAYRLCLQTIAEATGAPVKVVWVSSEEDARAE